MSNLVELAPVYLVVVGVSVLTIVFTCFYIKALIWLLKWALIIQLSALVVSLPFIAVVMFLEWVFGWTEQVSLRLVMGIYVILLVRAALNIFRKKRREKQEQDALLRDD